MAGGVIFQKKIVLLFISRKEPTVTLPEIVALVHVALMYLYLAIQHDLHDNT